MSKKKKKHTLPSAEEQKKDMIKRYGHSCNWVNVQMHLTYNEMMEYFGSQCEEFEPLCANCSNWVMWHKTGKAEISFEREEILSILKENHNGRIGEQNK